MKNTTYFKQAELLLRILPLIHKQEVFALKGGTAINFFFQDLPRLSVDIDLTYLPVNERSFALDEIRLRLVKISEEIKKTITGTEVIPKKILGTDVIKGLIVDHIM